MQYAPSESSPTYRPTIHVGLRRNVPEHDIKNFVFEERYNLRCEVIQSCWNSLTFRRNVLPPPHFHGRIVNHISNQQTKLFIVAIITN
jgi:hypothetical protein